MSSHYEWRADDKERQALQALNPAVRLHLCRLSARSKSDLGMQVVSTSRRGGYFIKILVTSMLWPQVLVRLLQRNAHSKHFPIRVQALL